MTVPHDDAEWTPSSLTGTDSSLTGSALEGGPSRWSSGTSTSTGSEWSSSTSSMSPREPTGSSLGSGWSHEDPPTPSTARLEAHTSLRLDSISAPHTQGPVSARIGHELLGGTPAARTSHPHPEPDPSGPEPAPQDYAPPQDDPPPRDDPPPQDYPPPQASAPAVAAPAAPVDYAAAQPSQYGPPEPVPYGPAAPVTPRPRPALVAPPRPSTGPSRTEPGRIRSMADLRRAKAEYERGHSTSTGGRAPARRNGAFSTLILGLISAGFVTAGAVQGDPAPSGSVVAFVAITIITGLVTMAKPVEPTGRNRVLAVIGMLLAVAAIVVQVLDPW